MTSANRERIRSEFRLEKMGRIHGVLQTVEATYAGLRQFVAS